ncbi:MAG: MATE family efflux transporter [Clostridia bacterium]|nr:MATE family efflux transporter [Clostridia bacterium]
MEHKENNFLEKEPVGKLMMKYAVPCIISLLVAALYNIVDQIFIANATYLGSYGNAANTVVFPLTVVALAIAVMIGDGACAFVSISLGAGKKEEAHKSIGSAVVLCVILSLIVTGIYLIFANGILTAFGGRVNEETFRQAQSYFFWITVGMPFYMFGQAMNPIIRSDGSPRFAMVSTLAGAVVNIILDPVFIFIFKWGMMGAALATILGQILTAVLAIWYLCHMKAVRLQKESFGLHFNLAKQYLALGMTSFLSQISLVAAMMAINNMIQKYGALDAVFSNPEYAQIPMAVVGIVMKFFQIVISIAVGMAAGCIPVVGYNVGAGRNDRVKALFTRLLIGEFTVGAVALIIVEFFPRQLIGIFGAANESQAYTDFAIKAFRTYLCLMPLATVNKGTFIYLQSVGKALASTMISMVREVIFGVGFALLLPIWFGLDGVLYSMPVSDFLTFIIAVFVIAATYRQLSVPTAQRTSEESKAVPMTGGALTDRIITIGRSYGAGGRTIAQKVAKKLNIPYYDSQLLEKAAKESGLSIKYLESQDEQGIILPTIYQSIGFGTKDYVPLEQKAANAQREIIEKIAAEGPCVIVGRRADLILRGKSDIFSVFICASEQYRIQHIIKREGMTEKEAKQRISKADRERSAYYNQAAQGKWGQPECYDLCINTDRVSIDDAADLIASSVMK